MVPARWSAALPFVALVAVSVLAGGLVSAASAFAPSEHAAWAVAYLVLVGGIAQVGLGVGQASLAREGPHRGTTVAELVSWNVGDAAVLAGPLLGMPPLVDIGGGLLAGALGLVAWEVRGHAGRAPWSLRAFRGLVALLVVSIPVGLVLAQLRPA
jgi:hypothetical protein